MVWYGRVVLDLLEEAKGVATVQKRRKTVERTKEKSLGMEMGESEREQEDQEMASYMTVLNLYRPLYERDTTIVHHATSTKSPSFWQRQALDTLDRRHTTIIR